MINYVCNRFSRKAVECVIGIVERKKTKVKDCQKYAFQRRCVTSDLHVFFGTAGMIRDACRIQRQTVKRQI